MADIATLNAIIRMSNSTEISNSIPLQPAETLKEDTVARVMALISNCLK